MRAVGPGGDRAPESAAEAISASGATVTGWANLRGNVQAFRHGDRLLALGLLPGADLSAGMGVSADGSVIVGYASGESPGEAFLWQGGEMKGLGFLPGGEVSAAFDVSDSGKVVVGSAMNAKGNAEAFRWTALGGMVGLGALEGLDSIAWAVSSNGGDVTGSVFHGAGYTQPEAFRWQRGSGMTGLGFPEGFEGSQAFGISADGKVIVGAVISSLGSYPALWSTRGSWLQLGPSQGWATDANSDGSVVVGLTFGEAGATSAMIWDQTNGVRSLEDALRRADVALDGWSLDRATGVSDDGKIVVGAGKAPHGGYEGFVACLP